MVQGDLIILDNFLPEREYRLVHQDAVCKKYSGVAYMGDVYGGIANPSIPFRWSVLNQKLGGGVIPGINMYRCSLDESDLVTWIHADTGMISEYAFVYYLSNSNQFSGTAFWNHKDLGISTLSSELIKEWKDDSILEEMLVSLDQDGMEMDMWKMEDFAIAKPNRLIVYPTSRFHSRFPKSGWGTGPWDGRLIHVGFFSKGK